MNYKRNKLLTNAGIIFSSLLISISSHASFNFHQPTQAYDNMEDFEERQIRIHGSRDAWTRAQANTIQSEINHARARLEFASKDERQYWTQQVIQKSNELRTLTAPQLRYNPNAKELLIQWLLILIEGLERDISNLKSAISREKEQELRNEKIESLSKLKILLAQTQGKLVATRSLNVQSDSFLNGEKISFSPIHFVNEIKERVGRSPFITIAIEGYTLIEYSNNKKLFDSIKEQVLRASEEIKKSRGKVVVLIDGATSGIGSAQALIQELRESGIKNLLIGTYIEGQSYKDFSDLYNSAKTNSDFNLFYNQSFEVGIEDSVMQTLNELQSLPNLRRTQVLFFEGSRKSYERIVLLANDDTFIDANIEMNLFLGHNQSSVIVDSKNTRNIGFNAATLFYALNRTLDITTNDNIPLTIHGNRTQSFRSNFPTVIQDFNSHVSFRYTLQSRINDKNRIEATVRLQEFLSANYIENFTFDILSKLGNDTNYEQIELIRGRLKERMNYKHRYIDHRTSAIICTNFFNI